MFIDLARRGLLIAYIMSPITNIQPIIQIIKKIIPVFLTLSYQVI